MLVTGGSTGERGIYLYSRSEWARAMAGVLRWVEFMEVPAKDLLTFRVAYLGGDSNFHVSFRMGASFSVAGLTSRRLLHLSPETPLDEACRKLNEFQPHILLGYPSYIRQLALSQMEGKLGITPKRVSFTAEVASAAAEEMVIRAWGTHPFSWYSATEAMGIACECAAHSGLHVYDDMVLLEFLNGEIVITNLFNRTFPVIRYVLGDLSEPIQGKCSCGRSLSRIGRIEGRDDDVLWFTGAEGKPVFFHPSHFWNLMDKIEGVEGFRIVLDDHALNVYLKVSPYTVHGRVVKELKWEILRKFSEFGVVEAPKVVVHFVDKLERTSLSKKVKCVEDRRSGRGGEIFLPPEKLD